MASNSYPGKTKTLVEGVLQILRVHPNASILVCAPSNPAADTVARRLAKTLRPGQMLRLNAPNRTFAEVADEVMLYCCIQDDAFSIPPYEELMRTQVVVCSCMDASILVTARATNAATMQAQYDLHTIVQPRVIGPRIDPHWTHLLIDEVCGLRHAQSRLMPGRSSLRAGGPYSALGGPPIPPSRGMHHV